MSELHQKYAATINTFNQSADAYLAHFKDTKLYRKSYENFLATLTAEHKSILDLACGPGHVSHYLLSHRSDLDLLGVDLAPAMIKLAKELNPNATFKVSSAHEVLTENHGFDAIVCGFLLPYLQWSDAQKLILKIPKKLNKAGILYLSYTTGIGQNDEVQKSERSTGQVYSYYHQIPQVEEVLLANKMLKINQELITHQHNGQTHTDVVSIYKKGR
ncbi:class I SAM-dependent methyltransferase [Marinicella sp. S1101]|uniref:class I SAM-dependent methyltransferase n=1 Tax=Marinicella marina TaxID=2996016 RepID=UPI002260ED83|nr:class I SAM-dependent methyltransferase [Marinicella marina]MCX7552916.1 class I SAM-dependent methyltransferase [Marinicella marina]MDJ1139775.1 class I SAM-dependent methyltransferase [Marinicella marina]